MFGIDNDGFYRISEELRNKEMKKDFEDFLRENPNPEDEEVHEWAEENGYEIDEVEELAYSMAHKYLGNDEDSDEDSEDLIDEHEDQIPGGKADNSDPEDFDIDQIAKGIKVEMVEHTDDPEKALEIAMDHLTELDDYYDRLDKMENK